MIETHTVGLAGYVTPAEAARRLKVSVAAVYKILTRHRIPALRIGHQLMVRLSDLEPYLGREG